MARDYYVEINSENFESYNLCGKLMSVADIIILSCGIDRNLLKYESI